MSKTKFLKIIKEREDLVSSAPQYFVDQLEKVQNNIYDDLLSFIKELDAKGGRTLETTDFNIKMANDLRYNIRKWLKKNGYYEALTEFGKKYNDVIIKSREYYNSMGLDGAFTARDLNTLSKIKKDDLDFLVSRDKDVINITYQECIDSIYNNKSWRILADKLKSLHTDTVLSSGAKLNGLLKKYNSTYAFTAFSAFDRRAQNIKAQQYGLDKFYYSGSLVMDSREFCVNRVGKIFTKKEIDSWNKMGRWDGKAEGRDVWTYLGGWNCQHILSPVTNEFAEYLMAA